MIKNCSQPKKEESKIVPETQSTNITPTNVMIDDNDFDEDIQLEEDGKKVVEEAAKVKEEAKDKDVMQYNIEPNGLYLKKVNY